MQNNRVILVHGREKIANFAPEILIKTINCHEETISFLPSVRRLYGAAGCRFPASEH